MKVLKADLNKFLLFFFLVSSFSVFTLYAEINAVNQFLPTMSFILFLLIIYVNFYLNKNDFLSPLTFFSIMYFGYVIGGYYYSFSEGEFGKFIGFTDIPDDEVLILMKYGLLLAFFSFVFFVIGYSIFSKKINFIMKSKTGFFAFYGKYYLILVVPLLIIGLSHWTYVANQTAGSIINLLLYFQAFPHMAEEAGVSTLPYHFYYAGIFVWLLGLAVNGKRLTFLFVFFSLLGLVINVTQGRITLAFTFILSQIVFLALLDSRLRVKVLFSFFILIVFSFIVYFLRIISNSLYIGGNASLYGMNFLNTIIGGGNVADLQQLVIIFYTFDLSDASLGTTYFDWFRNTFGSYFGLDSSSIGLIIKDIYVPETSGAPTPGAIGEAYFNFNIAAPLFFFFVGSLFSILYKKVMDSGNVFLLLIYSIFLARFIFIYPKVDSTMLSNFFWGAAPLSLLLLFMFVFYKLVKK